MIYLDTSWLVKLYVDEGDAQAVRGLVDEEPFVFASDLAYVEMHAAVARRTREAAMDRSTANEALAGFRREWPELARVAVSRDILARAADLVALHPLRSLDAVHLASALLVATGAPEPLRFGSADERLLAAARAEGLTALEMA